MARGDGRVYLRGSTYWVCYYLRGVQYRESTGTSEEKAAGKFLRAKLKEVHADEIGARPFVTPAMNKTTTHELLENLKADFELRKILSDQNRSGIKAADEAFGYLRATELSSKHVSDYIQQQLAENYANASINRILGFVEQAFTLAVKDEGFPKVPSIKRLSEKGNVRQGFCSKDEFLRVHTNLPDDLKDFCMFAFSTGWRRGEVAGLDWSNIQDNDTMIRLRPEQAKNKYGRKVPITGELGGIIERRRALRPVDSDGTAQLSSPVFHRGDGLRVGDFRKAWAKATKAAGLPGLLLHDLRRAAVTAMIQAKVPQLVAMQISGHRTTSMFHRYGITMEDELRDAMAATDAYHQEKIAQAEQKRNVVSIAQ